MCPGVYDVLYRFLSETAHGAATLVFRAKIDAERLKMQRVTGVKFDWIWADSCIALLSAGVLDSLTGTSFSFPRTRSRVPT